MAYDNSQYSYSDVLNSTTYYYMFDDLYRYSAGVYTMQGKLNHSGFWCGTPDGKFGGNTDEAVRHFQKAFSLTVDGMAGHNTLSVLDYVSSISPGFTFTSGSYGIYFDTYNKRFMHNQQTVYSALKASGLNKFAIAGFMGNLQVEHEFRTALSGTGSAIGLAQWEGTRKNNLQAYANANSEDITGIILQAWFIVEECTSGSLYADTGATSCFSLLANVSDITAASDYVTALYERCYYATSWSEIVNSGYSTSRFDTNSPNTYYPSRYYLDTPSRRGYASSYYDCLQQM